MACAARTRATAPPAGRDGGQAARIEGGWRIGFDEQRKVDESKSKGFIILARSQKSGARAAGPMPFFARILTPLRARSAPAHKADARRPQ
ncbi:hypothetical protein PSP6_610008 [Paraburkholderia tropica]|nr:hypothetical protein PSP6_610008 [Paraburkholderia tropica]